MSNAIKDSDIRPEVRLAGADLRGRNLECVYMNHGDLRGADLRRANIRDARFRWADVSSCDFRGADLRGSDMQYADMRWTDLRGADLRWAELFNANLYGADLRGVMLDKAVLESAVLVEAKGATHLLTDHRENVIYMLFAIEAHEGLRFVAGCRNFTLREALEHWGSLKYPDQDRGARYVDAITKYLGGR